MDCWDWEFFETELTSESFKVADQGPLFGPVTEFKVIRDDHLDLILETTSPSDSTSNAIELPAGTVYTSTAEVKFNSRFGSSAVATGVIPRSYHRMMGAATTHAGTKQTSSIYSLQWERHNIAASCYVIEWVENMSAPLIWPDFDDLNETGEIKRKLHSPAIEIVMSEPISSGGGSRSCVHLVIEGIDLFVGESKAKRDNIRKPGFILYKGTPDAEVRSKIRDCLSFCFGNFLLYLGDTHFDENWLPVSFNARSGHALVEDAERLTVWQPAPLGLRWQHEVNAELLERMVSSLYRIYDTYRLRSVFWSYWHALAAPVHMAAAHFGSALESLQRTYFTSQNLAALGKIVDNEQVWRDLYKKLAVCINQANLSDEQKRLLVNKSQNLNSAPQSIVIERFFNAIGLRIGLLERDVWVNRNRAAHGGAAGDENGSRLIRENKVLLIMLNRILLALGGGGDYYYDYYNLGRPTVKLTEPVSDDRISE